MEDEHMRTFTTDDGATVTLAEYEQQANDPDCGMTREDLADIAALEVGETTALGFTIITRTADAEVFYLNERTPEHFFDAVGTDSIAPELVGWYRWADGDPVGPFATEAEAGATITRAIDGVRQQLNDAAVEDAQERAYEDNEARRIGLI
jgi:hypothetical protein